MNWDAIAAVAELLGALGVIVSLVCLATQEPSSANKARQPANQSVVKQRNNVCTQMAADEDHADIWVRGSQGLSSLQSETEGVRFSAFLLSIFRPNQEIFWYRQQGPMDDWTGDSIGSQCHALIGTPGTVQWWGMRSNWLSVPFQKRIESILKGRPEYRRWSG